MIQFDNAIEYFKKTILTTLVSEDIEVWVAGGAVRNYFMTARMDTDIDLFFRNEVSWDKTKAYLLDNQGSIMWESTNGIKIKFKNRIFDLVKHYYNNPIDCINSFDFTVSMLAVDCNKVYHGESTFIDLAKKQLMINALPMPANTFQRTLRYYKKGFTMCVGEQAKLIKSLSSIEDIRSTDTPFEFYEDGGLFMPYD